MTIEKQIKLKQFKSETEKAIVNIAFTHSYFSTKINGVLKEYTISSQEFNVLRIIKGQHPRPVSIGNITSRMIDKMSNTSRIINKLEEKNLVQRVSCPFDRRQIDVFLTYHGTQILEKLNDLVNSVIDEHRHINDEHLSQLNTILDSFRLD